MKKSEKESVSFFTWSMHARTIGINQIKGKNKDMKVISNNLKLKPNNK